MMRKIAMIGATAAVALGTLATVPAAAAQPDAEALAAKKCAKGYVCFYTGHHLTGQRCSTKNTIDHWGSHRCRTSTFRSFVNNGKPGYKDDVRAYTKKNHGGAYYLIPNKAKGEFRGAAAIRSVQWFNH
ncbi:peptidase inhibitor family I36 protein [Streptomyces sp. NPDC050355]|uniref:peptidase inhibitor family I36 protein n=1 Tax=Streptomyces sp. NPDC050355 TaxID=3365609 RepID=UPI003795F5A8